MTDKKKYVIYDPDRMDVPEFDEEMLTFLRAAIAYMDETGYALDQEELNLVKGMAYTVREFIDADRIEFETSDRRVHNASIRIIGNSVRISDPQSFAKLLYAADSIAGFSTKTDGTVEIEMSFSLTAYKKEQEDKS